MNICFNYLAALFELNLWPDSIRANKMLIELTEKGLWK